MLIICVDKCSFIKHTGTYCMFTNKAVLRSRNYLFSAPTPAQPMSIISAPAPAPAIYFDYFPFKMYYNSTGNTIRNMSPWRFFFNLASSKLNAVNI